MTGSERDRPGRVNPFIRCDLIEGILEDWKLAEESMGRETRVDEKDKEFIRRLFAPHEYVSLLSLSLSPRGKHPLSSRQRSPRSDPPRCITWLPVPLEKVKVRGLVFVSFPVSPPRAAPPKLFASFSQPFLAFFFSIFFSRSRDDGVHPSRLDPPRFAGQDKSFVLNRTPASRVAIRIYSDYLLIREEGIDEEMGMIILEISFRHIGNGRHRSRFSPDGELKSLYPTTVSNQ